MTHHLTDNDEIKIVEHARWAAKSNESHLVEHAALQTAHLRQISRTLTDLHATVRTIMYVAVAVGSAAIAIVLALIIPR